MGTASYEGQAVVSASVSKPGRVRWWACLWLLMLGSLKLLEYNVVGVNPAVQVVYTTFFVIAGAVMLGGASFICLLRGRSMQWWPAINVYLLSSFIMAPVSIMRIMTVISGGTLHPSFIGFAAKFLQVAVFLIWVFERSRYFPPAKPPAKLVA